MTIAPIAGVEIESLGPSFDEGLLPGDLNLGADLFPGVVLGEVDNRRLKGFIEKREVEREAGDSGRESHAAGPDDDMLPLFVNENVLVKLLLIREGPKGLDAVALGDDLVEVIESPKGIGEVLNI